MNAADRCAICSQGAISTAVEMAIVNSDIRAFGADGFTVWKCSHCGSINSFESVDLNHYYRGYPVHGQKLDVFSRVSLRKRLSMLKELGLRDSDSILDYGCGNGLFVGYLKRKSINAFGYDPYSASYSSPQQLDRKYDALCSEQVIEHAVDPREMVNTWSALLGKGGMLFVGTPNAAEIDLSRPGCFRHDLHQPYHRHILSETALIDICERAGFKHLKTQHRVCVDTWFPFLNMSFLWAYVDQTGGFVDVLFDKPAWGVLFQSPSLLVKALFGRFTPSPVYMTCAFEKQG